MTYAAFGLASTPAFVLGDFNVDEPYVTESLQSTRLDRNTRESTQVDKWLSSKSYRCEHERGSDSEWHFTMPNSKNSRDYIWRVGNKNPGQTGCRVINPELHKRGSTYTFPDTTTRMKAFSSWKEVSDHYPVYARFFDPTKLR